MQDMTLDEALAEAFERARDLDVPLADKLQFFADAVRFASPTFADATERLVHRLQQTGTGATAPKVGDEMPDFVLPDEQGKFISLGSLLRNGPVALSFHRGHWCPYCRINTSALAEAQCQVAPLGGQIVAITPDLRRFSTILKPPGERGYFPILTDVDNGYAMSLNLAIFVGMEMRELMKGNGWDIAAYQGNDTWMLPIPATFIVDSSGQIASRYIDPDYRKRMAIEDIVDALKGVQN